MNALPLPCKWLDPRVAWMTMKKGVLSLATSKYIHVVSSIITFMLNLLTLK